MRLTPDPVHENTVHAFAKILMFRCSRSVQMLHNVKKNNIDLFEVHVLQGWVANSTPGIFQWNLPEYSGLENMPKVANMANMILVL